jgi:hypothetical protein
MGRSYTSRTDKSRVPRGDAPAERPQVARFLRASRLHDRDGAGLDTVLAAFGPWLMDQALAAVLTTNLCEPDAAETAMLSRGDDPRRDRTSPASGRLMDF